MRVIVVDHDSTMLETIVRALRASFVIDAVSTKGDCLDLLRQNDFDIVVACERLEDGSGLELLGQIARRWPATLRVFAADRERLRLLQGRLGPFELFQTLAYPIEPQKLLSTLTLAREAHEADADTTSIQHIVLGNDDSSLVQAPPPAPEPPTAKRAVAPPPRPAAPAPARSVSAPRRPPTKHDAPARSSLAVPAEAAAPVPTRVPAPPPTRAQSMQPPRPKATAPVYFGRRAEDAAAVIDSLSEAAEVAAAATRSRIEPLGNGTPASSKAFVAGAGCAVVLFAVVLAVTQLRSAHQTTPVAAASVAPQPQFSKAVTELVAAVEVDFEQDDFGKAQVDVLKLRTLAPDHPRLQFFLMLLDHNSRLHGAPPARVAAASTLPSKPASQRKMTAAASRSSGQSAALPATSPTPAAALGPKSPAEAAASRPDSEQPASETPRVNPAPAVTAASSAGTVADNTVSVASAADGARPALAATGRALDDSPPVAAAASRPTSAARAPAASSAPPSAQVTRTVVTSGGMPPPVTAEAQLTRRVPPEYPETAIRKGIEGYVDLHFTITPQGTVTQVAVVNADPADVFDHAATDAVRRWHYDPRVVDGQPVESQSQVRLQFRLDSHSSLSH